MILLHKKGKAIQNGRQKFKMAATELKTGQSSPIQTLKLKFEAVVLIDCMFYAYNVEGCIQVWNSNNGDGGIEKSHPCKLG